MAVFTFKGVSGLDDLTDKFQSNVDESLTFLASKDILAGRLVTLSKSEPIILTTTAQLISHGLGRPAKGYFVVKANAAASVYDDEATNTVKISYIKLLSTATVTVSLWVF